MTKRRKVESKRENNGGKRNDRLITLVSSKWPWWNKANKLITVSPCGYRPWTGTGQARSAVLNTDFSPDPEKVNQSIRNISVSDQINEPLPGSKLPAGPSQGNGSYWQERWNHKLTLARQTHSTINEWVIVQRDSLASGEPVIMLPTCMNTYTLLYQKGIDVPCTDRTTGITLWTEKHISLGLLYSSVCILETHRYATMTSAAWPGTLTQIVEKKILDVSQSWRNKKEKEWETVREQRRRYWIWVSFEMKSWNGNTSVV